MVRWRILLLVVVIAGCGGEKASEPAPDAPPGIELTSEAFKAGAPIPKRYTCDGDDRSPPLEIAGVPTTARALALIVEDPDAPGGTYTHWTVFAIPGDTTAFPEGSPPAGARQGENSGGDVSYGGPCPPEGDKAHRYSFLLYALKTELDLKQGAKPDEVRKQIDEHALARGKLVGTFKRG